MADDATKVRAGVTGSVDVAPTGTTAPTNATSALDPAFKDLGFIHEDGITETQDTSTEDIKAWQNGATVRKIQTEHDLMYNFTMLESNPVTLLEYYGNYVAQVGGASPSDARIDITGAELPHRVWAILVEDGDHLMRIVIKDGQITEVGDVVFANGEAVGREVTITCYPVNGIKATVYMNDAAVV